MKIFNYIKLGLLLNLSLNLAIFAADTGEQKRTAIPIKVQRNKTILPVNVGFSRSLNIVLDTGMSFDGLLIYNPDLKGKLALNDAFEVKIPGAGKGKPSTALMDTAARFSMGDVAFEDQKLLVLTNDIYKGFPSDGVLGYSIFGHYAVEIDYDKNVLFLHDYGKLQVDESWDSIPIYFKHNTIPWIDVSVAIENEEPIHISTYIDFASGESIELLEKENMKYALPKQMEKAYLGRGLSGDIHGKTGTITKLKIGKYELHNLKAAIAPASVRSKQKNADAIIGNNSLRRFNLIFDYRHKCLYIKPNGSYENVN